MAGQIKQRWSNWDKTPNIVKSWVWTREETKLYREYCEGNTLHVCAGFSNFGDIKIDIEVKLSDVNADGMYLPILNQSVDVSICDPPWLQNTEFKILKELRRVTKKRILFITHNRIAFPKNTPWSLKELWVLFKIPYKYPKLFYVFEKDNNEVLDLGGSD